MIGLGLGNWAPDFSTGTDFVDLFFLFCFLLLASKETQRLARLCPGSHCESFIESSRPTLGWHNLSQIRMNRNLPVYYRSKCCSLPLLQLWRRGSSLIWDSHNCFRLLLPCRQHYQHFLEVTFLKWAVLKQTTFFILTAALESCSLLICHLSCCHCGSISCTRFKLKE